MPTIRFVKSYPPLQVKEGSILMQALLAAGLPVASSCNGDGVCGKCRVTILSGEQNLSPLNELEKMLKERLKIPPNVRIACQVQVMGDIVIDTSYW